MSACEVDETKRVIIYVDALLCCVCLRLDDTTKLTFCHLPVASCVFQRDTVRARQLLFTAASLGNKYVPLCRIVLSVGAYLLLVSFAL